MKTKIGSKEAVTDVFMMWKKAKGYSFKDMAEKMGIALMTVHQRRKNHNWTITEEYYIMHELLTSIDTPF